MRTSETDTIEINDGTKDISATPTHLLLLRKLDHLSTEESIFNAVNSLQGVHRALLIRDKMTKMSSEFAFVEFDSVQVNFPFLMSPIHKSLTLNGFGTP